MFRYICVTLREFQTCTSLKLRSFHIIKIPLKIVKLKDLCSCFFIKSSRYDFYSIMCQCYVYVAVYTSGYSAINKMKFKCCKTL